MAGNTANQIHSAATDKIRIRCPNCGSTFRVKAGLLGKRGPCKECRQPFTITSNVVVPEPPPASPRAAEHRGDASPTAGPPRPRDVWNSTAQPETPSRSPAAPPVRAARPTPSKSAVFTSREFGYHFGVSGKGWRRYPANMEKKFEADVALEHPDGSCIKCVVDETQLELSDIESELAEAYASEVHDFQFHRQGATKIDGVPALYIEYGGRQPDHADVPCRFLTHVFVRDDHIYQIIAWCPQRRFERLRRDVATTVRTMSFGPVTDSQAAVDPTIEDDFGLLSRDHKEVLFEGLKWGQWGAVAGLLLGVLALLSGAGVGWVAKLLVIPCVTLFVGLGAAAFRWGRLAASDGGAEALDKVIWVLFLPVYLWEFIFCMLGMPARGLSRVVVGFGRIFYGFISSFFAGPPYAIYVALTKRVEVNGPGYVGFAAIGLFPAMMSLALLMNLLVGPPPKPGADQAQRIDGGPNPDAQAPAAELDLTSGEKNRALPGANRTASESHDAGDQPGYGGADDSADNLAANGDSGSSDATPAPTDAGGDAATAQDGAAPTNAAVVGDSKGDLDGGVSTGLATAGPASGYEGHATSTKASERGAMPGDAAGSGAPPRLASEAAEDAGQPSVVTNVTELAAILDTLGEQRVIWVRLERKDVTDAEMELLRSWVKSGGVLWSDTDLVRVDMTGDRKFGFRMKAAEIEQKSGSAFTYQSRTRHPILEGLGKSVDYTLSPSELVVSISLPRNGQLPDDLRLLLGWPPKRTRTIQAVCAMMEYGKGLLVYRPREVSGDSIANTFENNLTTYSFGHTRYSLPKEGVAKTSASVRTWTDQSGKHTIHARLVKVEKDQVTLDKGRGDTVSLSIDKLSAADQQYLRGLTGKRKRSAR